MGEMIKIRQQSGGIQAYKAVPEKIARYNGAIIIAHELWGLTEQIKHLADRFTEKGYLVLAPDLFSTDKEIRRPSMELQKRIFNKDERVRYEAMPKFRALVAPTQTPKFRLLALSRLESCFEYLYNQPLAHQKVSIVGFGLGGEYAFELALRERRLHAAVVFYGKAPSVGAELRHIKASILGFYGGKERTLTDAARKTISQMEMAGVPYESMIYAQAGHGFFDEENAYSYDKDAAQDAWKKMVDFIGGAS
jgi:carboxymethylenebutenolidase